jgi:hypothetical protein
VQNVTLKDATRLYRVVKRCPILLVTHGTIVRSIRLYIFPFPFSPTFEFSVTTVGEGRILEKPMRTVTLCLSHPISALSKHSSFSPQFASSTHQANFSTLILRPACNLWVNMTIAMRGMTMKRSSATIPATGTSDGHCGHGYPFHSPSSSLSANRQNAFSVIERVMCKRSEFFHDAMSGPWKSTQERKVDLSERRSGHIRFDIYNLPCMHPRVISVFVLSLIEGYPE